MSRLTHPEVIAIGVMVAALTAAGVATLAPADAAQPAGDRLHVIAPRCDASEHVVAITFTVTTPGTYTLLWDNADACAPPKDST